MKIKRIDGKHDLDQEVRRIELQVGSSVITLTEEHGQLKVFGDASDLLISCGARNAFSVVCKED